MSVDTIEFTADDVALAIQDLTEEATDDIVYQNRNQMASDTAIVTNNVRSKVLNVTRLHGISVPGDASEGREDGALAVRAAVQSYANDPDAYINAINDAADAADLEEDTPAPTSKAQAPNLTPSEALVVVPMAPAASTGMIPAQIAAEPHVEVNYVPRTLKGLFPGISEDYATETINTAKWTASSRPKIGAPDPHYTFNGFQVKVMASALRRRKNVMAVGDPGCGKTEFFKQLAARIGLPYHGITFDGQLSRAEIIGSFRQVATPTGSATPFVDGLIPTLIQRPGILCLNEIDQCDPDIQYMLHDMYEGGGLTIQEDGGRFVPRHPDCYIVATANTKGRGSDTGLTHARYEMSEATRDRYPIWLNFTYLEADAETKTIEAKTELNTDLAKKLVAIGNSIRTGYKNGDLAQPCSLRQMLDVAEITQDFMDRGGNEALALACDLVIVGRANEEDTMAIREFVKANLAVDLNRMTR